VDWLVLTIFAVVYLGMLLGEIPGLALDRTGVALLGALALVAAGRMTPDQAWQAVDVPTLALLFGLMVVSAQLRLGGFYTWLTRRLVAAQLGPSALLLAVVAVAGLLSAVLANDIGLAPAGRADPGPVEHPGGQPADRRQHRQHHRGRAGGRLRPAHRLARARARGRPGHAGHPGPGRGLAGAPGLSPQAGDQDCSSIRLSSGSRA
jgi:hypothetical protein